MRLKITGYYSPEPEEIDEDATIGITAEADSVLFGDERGTGLKVADLEDIEVERVPHG